MEHLVSADCDYECRVGSFADGWRGEVVGAGAGSDVDSSWARTPNGHAVIDSKLVYLMNYELLLQCGLLLKFGLEEGHPWAGGSSGKTI